MALPLVPYSTTLRYPLTGAVNRWIIQKTGSRQSRPYDIPTNATFVFARNSNSGPGAYYGPDLNGSFGWGGTYRVWNVSDNDSYNGTNASWFKGSQTDALHRVLNRLQALAYDERASAGVAIGEYREASSMISNRLAQLYRGFNSLKRLRFFDAAMAFGLVQKKRPPRRRAGKSGKLYWRKHPKRNVYYPTPQRGGRGIRGFSSLILEYNWGWAPLIKDAQAALAVIQRDPFIDRKINTRRTDARSLLNVLLYDDGRNRRMESHWLKTTVRAGGTYRVSNPNYDLLDRLGLANLASVALELVPFSFLANYILNLDEVVQNLSSGFRSNMVDTWWSVKTEAKRTYSDLFILANRLDAYYTSESVSYKRVIGSLPNYTLRIRQRFMPSWTRAATSSSLMVVLFWGKKV